MIVVHLIMVDLDVLQKFSLIPENKFYEKKVKKKVESDLIFSFIF